MALCRSEEGLPWDGTDQTIMFQMIVSFLYACAEGVFRICLKSRVEDYILNNHWTTK